jgi:uncharacterized protein YcfJ
MNKSALIGTVFGVTVATAAAGLAGYSLMDKEVTGSAVATVATQTCYEVQVETPLEPKDKRRIAGTVIGAVVGGAVGKDVGDRDVTTAAGAAVGALAGNQVQKKIQEQRTVTTTETRCEPATKSP